VQLFKSFLCLRWITFTFHTIWEGFVCDILHVFGKVLCETLFGKVLCETLFGKVLCETLFGRVLWVIIFDGFVC
jgi:hypothetical protein